MASVFAALAVACGTEDASSRQVAIDEQVAIPARVHVEPLSLEELTAESTTIVHGKVTEVSVRRMQLVVGEPPSDASGSSFVDPVRPQSLAGVWTVAAGNTVDTGPLAISP